MFLEFDGGKKSVGFVRGKGYYEEEVVDGVV